MTSKTKQLPIPLTVDAARTETRKLLYGHPSYPNRHNGQPLEFIGLPDRCLANYIYLMMIEAKTTSNLRLLEWSRTLEERMYISTRPLIMLD